MLIPTIMKVVLISIGTFSSLLNLTMMLFIYLYRSHQLIKSTSVFISITVIIGLLIGKIPIFLGSFSPNSLICTIILICHPLSFHIVFTALLIKAIRIYRLFRGSRRGNPIRCISSNSIIIQFLLAFVFEV